MKASIRSPYGFSQRSSGDACASAIAAIILLTRVAAAAEPAANNADDTGLAEITVTAEKYNSTIQNTPISISALSGDQLTAAGITSIDDVVRDIPGLSTRSAGPGLTELEARGLASNGGAAPTVGFYLDEVPLTPPALSQSGKVVIDPNLYDVDRVEVLRGPQGTLYGSGSLGGTVKVVTNQPKLDTWEGSVQGTLSDTQGGSGNGGGNFALNIPFGDTLALRIVGTDTYRSGWIDRVVVSPFPQDNGPIRGNVLAAPVQDVIPNVNTESLYGARASILFEPSSVFRVTASALYQRLVLGGYDNFDSPPGAAYLAHYEAFNIPEPVKDTVHVYSITAVGDLGFADLTSATSYYDRLESQTQDASESASIANGIFPYVNTPFSETDPSNQFTEELRLSSHGDDRLHWVGGAFYSKLYSIWDEYGQNEVYVQPGNPTGILFETDNRYKIEQTALFADGSYKFTDQWKLEAGVRWYRYQSSQLQQEWGYDTVNPAPAPSGRTAGSNSGFNPRIDLSYSPTADLTTYISASRGFRPGGANIITPPANTPPLFCSAGAGPSFGPDSVWDYEVGEKAKLLDNRVTVNGDFYYITWKGIQQTLLLACGYEYEANAGNARSFGPEFEINAKLSDNWQISLNGTYTDVRVTQPNAAFLTFLTTSAPTIGGGQFCKSTVGCTAPVLNVPKDTGSVALLYSTPLLEKYQLTGRLSATYTGSSFDEAYDFGIPLPSYTIAAARIGLSSSDRWSVSLFVDNFTNTVALETANNTSFQYNIQSLVRYTTNQPRTFGTQFNYHF